MTHKRGLIGSLALLATFGATCIAAAQTKTASANPTEADLAFGYHLSSQCVTCHQNVGSAAAIPSITHRPVDDFIQTMQAYKLKLRPHQVMQIVAGSLSEDEIAALAAYYATLN